MVNAGLVSVFRLRLVQLLRMLRCVAFVRVLVFVYVHGLESKGILVEVVTVAILVLLRRLDVDFFH